MSEITDLSYDDIMTTSKQLLSQKEQSKLDKYNAQFRKIMDYQIPKHNCFAEVPIE